MNQTQILFAGVLLILGVGIYGLLVSRHLIKLVVCMQVLVKAAILAIAAAGVAVGQPNLAQSLGLTVIVVDTIAAVIALALAVQVKRQTGTLDGAGLSRLKG